MTAKYTEPHVRAVQAETDETGGLTVRITVRRPPAGHAKAGVDPDPRDVPADVRASLLAWLDPSRW